MCDQIKADGGGQAVFLNGAVGGMVSGDNKARTHEEAKVMGLGLAELVKDLATTAQPPATFDFGVDTRRVEIPMTNAGFKPLLRCPRRTESRPRGDRDGAGARWARASCSPSLASCCRR